MFQWRSNDQRAQDTQLLLTLTVHDIEASSHVLNTACSKEMNTHLNFTSSCTKRQEPLCSIDTVEVKYE